MGYKDRSLYLYTIQPMKRIQRPLSQKSVLLLCLLALSFFHCSKGLFVTSTHWFGKVIDPTNNQGIPRCRIVFYILENNKGNWDPEEICEVLSGRDGSYDINFTHTIGDNDYEISVDSIPVGYENYFMSRGRLDPSLFENSHDVNMNIYIYSKGFMKVHVVGDGDSPKMELGWESNVFYHGCNTNIVFTGRGNRLFDLKYTMYDANNPGVKFERWFNDVLPRQDTVYKELHF